MGAAPRHRQGIAAGILATARNMGMALGVGLAGAIFTTFLGQEGLGNSVGIYQAIQISFQVMAFIALFGAIVAAIRPEKPRTGNNSSGQQPSST